VAHAEVIPAFLVTRYPDKIVKLATRIRYDGE
jgi:hypothetical protein